MNYRVDLSQVFVALESQSDLTPVALRKYGFSLEALRHTGPRNGLGRQDLRAAFAAALLDGASRA